MKENRTVLEDKHPLVLIMFFFGVILISMFENNIISGILSTLAGFIFILMTSPLKEFIKRLVTSCLIVILVAATNPFFSHDGLTILFFVNSQAYTLEALVYGIHIGLMLVSVLNWFAIMNMCIDSDKWMYLTGRLLPGLGLLLSMVLRLIPIMKSRFRDLKAADDGIYAERGVLRHLKLFLGMAGWTMEYMPRTAASMRARGYGNGKRTCFSIYSFRARDFIELMICLLIIVPAIVTGAVSLKSDYYYPVLSMSMASLNIVFYCLAGLLFLLPAVLEGVDRLIWTYYKSKI